MRNSWNAPPLDDPTWTKHFEPARQQPESVKPQTIHEWFIAEVERRAEATREEMLEALAEERKGGYRSAGHMRYAAWLRRILGEAK
jgi:hypothetical protein